MAQESVPPRWPRVMKGAIIATKPAPTVPPRPTLPATARTTPQPQVAQTDEKQPQ